MNEHTYAVTGILPAGIKDETSFLGREVTSDSYKSSSSCVCSTTPQAVCPTTPQALNPRLSVQLTDLLLSLAQVFGARH